ncbi:bifunctional folylpolyglutamate synthase/dihydrofolate synthase [Ascidiimonas sp. W6]|uniref:bifunctional folylpolyglutamate synthase/dihydrofolate synthase n=1 Tax=Ascidiimonas meishanensis TaxID=3128903 RepID=UPI0030EBF92F
MNTYKEVVAWMFSRLPMYQRQGKSAFKAKLDNSIAFSKYLGCPERTFKSVHIAGTNGKGSTSHMMASVLQEAGYNAGLYTSPHLKDFRERIRINGVQIPESRVISFINSNKEFLEEHELSFFEMTVAMAFNYFAEEKVDIAIVETGLGGRLDSTNIITPILSVITNIGYDHTDMLGDTLGKIAAEKAGIIKKNIPVVIGEYHPETCPIFKEKAQQMQTSLVLSYEQEKAHFNTDLKGSYQSKNMQTATVALNELKDHFFLSNSHFSKGLESVTKNTGLRGRWQQLKEHPIVICDVAHNKEGLALAMEQIQAYDFQYLHIVLGVVKDKKLEEILPLFPKGASYYFCKPGVPRGLEVSLLKEKAALYGLKGNAYASVSEAYKIALQQAKNTDFIYVGGSTFTVAEII